METKELVVKKEDVNKRIDVLICEKFKEFSRSYVQKLILKNCVMVNNKNIDKNYKVKFIDVVKINFPEPEKFEVLKQNIPLNIVYEDEEFLIVNKKRGMVVHPATGNFNNTLVNALMWYCEGKLSSIGGILRPGIVHRLDKNTTGLMVVAKTDEAFKSISTQIKNRSLTKIYEAIVHGNFKEKKGTINLPIGRHFKNRKKMAINFKNGKDSITHFKVLEEFKDFSYVKLKLETGRTHQIRVHMAHINHPIAGDDVYGYKTDFKKYGLNFGQCLHAKELEFFHYKLNKKVKFKAEADEYFLNFLNKCQKRTILNI